MVVGYRALNKVAVKNHYPLPRIDDLFDKLFGAQYFSCLDAASELHQILLRDEDKSKTAFRIPFGHYQFRDLHFGLTNASATFQAVMNNLFNLPMFNADESLNPRHSCLSLRLCSLMIFSFSANLLMSTGAMLRLSCLSYASIEFCSNPLSVFGSRLSFLVWVISFAETASSPTLKGAVCSRLACSHLLARGLAISLVSLTSSSSLFRVMLT